MIRLTSHVLYYWCIIPAAAIGCLWLLIPVELDINKVLPNVVAFLDAQRSGVVLPNATMGMYPWLQPSGAGDPISGAFYMGVSRLLIPSSAPQESLASFVGEQHIA